MFFWKVCRYFFSFFQVSNQTLINALYHNPQIMRDSDRKKKGIILWKKLELKLNYVKATLSEPTSFKINGLNAVIAKDLYKQFNYNIEILENINEPVTIDALGEIIDKDSYRFEIMIRELYSMSSILLKIIKDYKKTPDYTKITLSEEEYNVNFVMNIEEFVDEMTILRSAFSAHGHIHFL